MDGRWGLAIEGPGGTQGRYRRARSGQGRVGRPGHDVQGAAAHAVLLEQLAVVKSCMQWVAAGEGRLRAPSSDLGAEHSPWEPRL